MLHWAHGLFRKVPLVKSVPSKTRGIFSYSFFIQLLLNAVDCMPSRLKPRLPSSLPPCCTYRQYGRQALASSHFLCVLDGRDLFTPWASSRTQSSGPSSQRGTNKTPWSSVRGTYGGMAPPAVSGVSPYPPPWLGATRSQGPL